MALFVYITKECEKEAKKYGRWEDVLKLRERTIADQRTNLFDKYPPPYLKKRFARQQRLIAAEIEVGEHIVVCFYRMLIRGDNEYNQFKNNPTQYGDHHFAPLVDKDMLKNWIEEQLEQVEQGNKERPSDVEQTFLWDVITGEGFDKSDTFIYESVDWVKTIQDKDYHTRLYPIAEAIVNTSDTPSLELQTLPIPSAGNLEVLYRHFKPKRKVFLAGIYQANDQEEKNRLQNRYQNLLVLPVDEVNDDDIIRSSARSYPALITADSESWIAIEKNDESNLALSPEESALLESAHSLSEEDSPSGFPLFINGRAGSGKSTILQYLFTDYIVNYIKHEDEIDPPLYLTYSDKLVKRSREVVENLVKSGYQYTFPDIQEEKLQKIFDRSFKEFKSFLLGMISPEQREELFPKGKYVNYPTFQKEWEKRFCNDPHALKEYGPDISWHIIRTYIKGISVDDYMDPEEYTELPQEERSVSRENYEKVYERVWERWYKDNCQPDNPERKYWDDQDLVRFVLNEEYIDPVYPAIFCDEAQDFTRIELEAILRLSLFSERNLNGRDLSRVPFAFAGDPLQTLNPTGFRWETIKSVFVQKFIHSLDPHQRFGKNELNYRELSFNYRSTKNIVRLNNSIQAFRSALFDYKNLQPQLTWQYEEKSPSPLWFDKKDIEVEKILRNQVDLTIVVPCGEGGEKEFVENDPYLQNIIETDDEGIPRNILSPARAKGLEFTRVALYGFGENMPSGFYEFSNSLETPMGKEKDESILSYGYFINQLYVAASRPQKRLFIVDTREGINSLWRFATDLDFQSSLLESIRDGKRIWGDHLGTLHKGDSKSWSEDQEDPLERARQLEQEGRSKPDSFLLKQAAMAYRQIKRLREYHLCRGKAFEIEEEYLKAGESFTEGESFEDARKAFWKGGYYPEINRLSKSGSMDSSIETRIAYFLAEENSTTQCKEILNQVIERMEENLSFSAKVTSSNSWELALNKMLDRLLDLKDFKSDQLRININQWFVLLEKGVRIDQEQLARLCLKNGDIQRAEDILERINKLNLPEYRKAKGKAMISQYNENPDGEFSKEEKKYIADHLFREKEYVKAARLFREIGSVTSLAKCINGGIKDSLLANEELIHLSEIFLEQLVKTGNWPDSLRFLRTKNHSSLERKYNSRLKKLLKDSETTLEIIFIQEAAVSPFLPIAENKQKAAVSNFLKERFIVHPNSELIEKIHPLAVGAAFERAGRDIDTLQYYEQLEKRPDLEKDEKRTVMERWIRTKQKQAIRERDRGLIMVSEKHFEEADKKAKERRIVINDLAEFPKVFSLLTPVPRALALKPKPEVTSAGEPKDENDEASRLKNKENTLIKEEKPADQKAPNVSRELPDKISKEKEKPAGHETPHVSRELPGKTSFEFKDLQFTVSRSLKKLSIEKEQSMERIAFSLKEEFSVTSSDPPYVFNNKVASVKDWKIEVRKLKRGDVEISFPDSGLKIVLEM
jgi:hypothetical protein